MQKSKTTILHPPKNITDTSMEFDMVYRKKNITLRLEFPRHQNEASMEQLTDRLKAIYIKKIQTKIRQSEQSTLQITSLGEEEEHHHG